MTTAMPTPAGQARQLCSVADLKTYLSITSADTDALLGRLIEAATGRIESITDRVFHLLRYVERRDGIGESMLQLTGYPVKTVIRVASGSRAAMTVRYSGSGIRAVASVNETGLILKDYDTVGVETINELSFDDFGSTSALAAEVNDNVVRWNATVVENVRTVELNRVSNLVATHGDATLDYPIEWDDPYVVDYQRGSIRIDKGRDHPLAWHPVDWDELSEARRPMDGFQNVLIEYDAGFDPIPGELQQACIELAAQLFLASAHDLSIPNEKLDE